MVPTNEIRWINTKFKYGFPIITSPPVIENGHVTPPSHFKLQQKWNNKFTNQRPEFYLEEWRDVPVFEEDVAEKEVS